MRVKLMQTREQRTLFDRGQVPPRWDELRRETRQELTKLLEQILVAYTVRTVEEKNGEEASDE